MVGVVPGKSLAVVRATAATISHARDDAGTPVFREGLQMHYLNGHQ
jgi:hypothetical protein